MHPKPAPKAEGREKSVLLEARNCCIWERHSLEENKNELEFAQ